MYQSNMKPNIQTGVFPTQKKVAIVYLGDYTKIYSNTTIIILRQIRKI